MMTRHRMTIGAAVTAAALTLAAGAGGQAEPKKGDEPGRHGVLAPPPTQGPDIRTPPMVEGVLRALEAKYLTDAERASLRVFHGVWTDADLADPALRAKAAVIAGVFDDPSLLSDTAAPEDRAQAALRRGEPGAVLQWLAGAKGSRPGRLRAEALEMLGRHAEAVAEAEALLAALKPGSSTAEDVTEAALALQVRGRILGLEPGDYGRMMEMLSAAQQNVDRLYWPAVMAQASILMDKDNPAEAEKAARQVLTMNPSCAQAWRLLGEMAVSGFAFDAADSISVRLRTISSRFTTTVPGGVDAAMIAARARMRQNAPDLAEEALAPLLSAFPVQRDALALRAAVQAQRFDFDDVEKRLGAADAMWTAPTGENAGPIDGLLAVGRALSELRQYDRAAAYFRRASARSPKAPDPLIELGLLSVQAGKDVEARDALKAAAAMDPFNIRAMNSLTLVEELSTYTKFESEHFIVRCRPGVDEVVAKELLLPLERIHAVVCSTFEHTPPQRTIIELMPDHEWFAVRITGMPGIHTIAASTGPIIAMEAPREGKGHYGVYDWERVIRHEFTHTVNLSQTGYRLPHWFTEAAAVSLELAPYDFNTCRLLVHVLETDQLFNLREINEAFVRPKKQTDRQQAYMQGNWMYRYIADSWGKSAPIRLLERFATGEREEQAFPKVLGVSTEKFMEGFREWAAKDAASWGMLASPSLDDLRLKWMLTQDAERAGLASRLGQIGVAAAAMTAGLSGVGGGGEIADRLGVELAPALPDMVESWLIENPDHPDLLELELADALTMSGGEATPELVPLLERYAAARKVDPTPHRVLARYYLKSETPEKAIEHLEFLDIREQYSPVYAEALSERYAQAGDLDKAWSKIERATRIAGYDPALREKAATVALQRSDPKEAERHIEALVALEPQQEIHKQRLEAVRKMVDGR